MARGLGVAAGIPSLACLAACGDSSIFVERTWPAHEQAVIVVAAPDLTPLEGQVHLVPGESARLNLRLDASGGRRLLVRTYPAVDSGGPDLAECGVGLGQSQFGKLPPPRSAWVSDEFNPETRDRVRVHQESIPSPLDLGFLTECNWGCAGIRVRTQATDIEGVPRGIGETADGRLVVGMVPRDDTAAAAYYFDVNSYQPAALSLDPGDVVTDLTTDAAGNVYLTSARGALLQLDAEGAVVASSTTGLTRPMLARTGTGPVLLYRDRRALQLVPGSTDAVELPELPDSARHLAAHDLERMALVSGDSIWTHGEEGDWVREYRGVLDQRDTALARDASTMLYVSFSDLLLRSADGQWTQPPLPYPSAKLFTVAALGGGRYVVGGEFGLLAYWTGESWCRFEAATTSWVVALTAGRDPDQVYGAAGSPAQPATVFRVDLPTIR